MSLPVRPLRRAVSLVAALALASSLVASTAAGAQDDPPDPDGPPVEDAPTAVDDPDGPPDPPPVVPLPPEPYARGQAAVDRLGADAAAVAAAVGLPVDELIELLLSNPALAIDPELALTAVDPPAPGEEIVAVPADRSTPSTGPVTAPDGGHPELALASHPGAETTIHLDFDGHLVTGTAWNRAMGAETIVASGYDTDGDPARWSAAELAVIAGSWAAVAEDFAPFAVNVTTAEPDPADLVRDGPDDRRWGVRVVITGSDVTGCGCGAQSMIGSVDDPVLVLNRTAVGIAGAASHQVGHALGLADDGQAGGEAVYGGHDGPGGGWAPIMGAPNGRTLTQWSRQDHFGADNDGDTANFGRGPDDLAILGSSDGGFGLRPDDHGGPADPTPLNGPEPRIDGLIGSADDRDGFGFSTTGGPLVVRVEGATATNLDIDLTLIDQDGAVVARGVSEGEGPIAELGAVIDTVVAAGTYTVVVEGEGAGLAFLDPPFGSSGYGSVGRYTLTGSLAGVAPADTTPPSAPQGLIGLDLGVAVVLGWSPPVDDDVDAFLVRRSNRPGGPYLTVATLSADQNGYEDLVPATADRHYVVVARDLMGNESAPSTEIVIAAPPPPEVDPAPEEPAPDLGPEPEEEAGEEPEASEDEETPEGRDDEIGSEGPVEEGGPGEAGVPAPEAALALPSSVDQTFVYGTVIGQPALVEAADGEVQRITETLSGGAPSARHDRLDHRWALPAAPGNQELHLVVTADPDAGDADEGFAVEWSSDRIEWERLVVVEPGQTVDDVFPIGPVDDVVHVRVVDTDRTPRQQSPDAVSVDLVMVVGDGLPVEPPPEATEASAEVGFHFQGLGEGERAVVVTAVVRDDQGDPVSGAAVEVQVGGDVDETVTVTTGADGSGVAQTEGAALRPEVVICLASVEATDLVWQPGPDTCVRAEEAEESVPEPPDPAEPAVDDVAPDPAGPAVDDGAPDPEAGSLPA